MKRLLPALALISLPSFAQQVTDLVTARSIPAVVNEIVAQFGGRPLEVTGGRVIRAWNEQSRAYLACDRDTVNVFHADPVVSRNRRRTGVVINVYQPQRFGTHSTLEMVTGPDGLREDERNQNWGITTVGYTGKTVSVFPDRVELANVLRGGAFSPLFSVPIPVTRTDRVYTFRRGSNGRFLPTFTVHENARGRTGWERTCTFTVK